MRLCVGCGVGGGGGWGVGGDCEGPGCLVGGGRGFGWTHQPCDDVRPNLDDMSTISRVRYWHGRRPMAGRARGRCWRGLQAMQMQLNATLARELADDSDLSYPDYMVLVVLTDQADGRRRAFELGHDLGWEKSRVSHHVSRMVDRGLVRRDKCPSDQRGSFVVVTDEGRAAIGRRPRARRLRPSLRDRSAHARAARRPDRDLRHGGAREADARQPLGPARRPTPPPAATPQRRTPTHRPTVSEGRRPRSCPRRSSATAPP